MIEPMALRWAMGCLSLFLVLVRNVLLFHLDEPISHRHLSWCLLASFLAMA
jgi:hypothetical protein